MSREQIGERKRPPLLWFGGGFGQLMAENDVSKSANAGSVNSLTLAVTTARCSTHLGSCDGDKLRKDSSELDTYLYTICIYIFKFHLKFKDFATLEKLSLAS